MKRIFLISGFLAVAGLAHADYVVTGSIEGSVCTSYVLFKSCGFHKIDAVKGTDGKLYPMNASFSSVSEYDESKRRCWIGMKSEGGGMAGSVVNSITNALTDRPELFEKVGSRFEQVDPDYVTFPCVKR